MSEAELAFVPAEHHERLQKASSVNRVRCSIPMDRWVEHGREVYVSFYGPHETRVVHMYLKEFHALSQIKDMARDMFPPYSWRVFYGSRECGEYEFFSDKEVWNAIQQGIIYDFEYLTVHLDRI
uniref:DUF4265 domain-containing protein n=1 Tax=Caenorhabditis tropicalis TaxID=1561998 RepID=A0A1I7UE00_9PELO